jgi:hypothetical protein
VTLRVNAGASHEENHRYDFNQCTYRGDPKIRRHQDWDLVVIGDLKTPSDH